MTCRLFSDYSEDLVFQGCPLSPSSLELAPLKDEIGSPLCQRSALQEGMYAYDFDTFNRTAPLGLRQWLMK